MNMTKAWPFLLGALGGAGCHDAQAVNLPKVAPFIALERDFQGFEDWQRIELPKREAQGATHAEGDAVEYVNQLPKAGLKEFPVGTVLVKTVDDPKRGHEIFAMVKRGGGFNGQGAHGWEWFELKQREDDSVGIKWRGINAPSGESYGGDPMGGCNGCHEMATKNDFVHAAALTLSKI